jgi:hypothetical protein
VISPPTLAKSRANADIKGLWPRLRGDRVETAWRFATAEREAGSTSVMALTAVPRRTCAVWAVGGNVIHIYNGSAWATVSSPRAQLVARITGGDQEPSSTCGAGSYTRSTRLKAPAGAGSQFTSVPVGRLADTTMVSEPSARRTRPGVSSPIE